MPSTKQRKADRLRRMNRVAQKAAGVKVKRVRGPMSLLKDPQRFEIELFMLFSLKGQMPNFDAGRMTALLLGPVKVDPLTTITEGWFNFSGDAVDHRLVNKETGRENYCERISAKAARVCARGHALELTGRKSEEFGWVLNSMGWLADAFVGGFEPAATALAFEELDALGWREPLREMRDRWSAAMRTNFAPADQELIQRAIAKIRLVRERQTIP